MLNFYKLNGCQCFNWSVADDLDVVQVVIVVMVVLINRNWAKMILPSQTSFNWRGEGVGFENWEGERG
jgi:hypothetical protein